MAITSTTTLAEAKAEYLANAGYAETGSVATAKAFVTACRALIVLLPSSSTSGPKRADFSVASIKEERDRAEQWIKANANASGRVRHFDFSDLRC